MVDQLFGMAVAEGVLLGECLESLQPLQETRFWPEWQDAIMFFENSEGTQPPEKVDGILIDYESMGVRQEHSD